jgi:homoserine kinase
VDREKIARAASALEGHPDNATPAVWGGFCISGEGTFERVEMDAREYLVLIPEVEIHTEAARAALPKDVSLRDAVYNLQRAALGAARVARHRHLGALAPFEDRLHQRHRLALEPRLREAFHEISKLESIGGLFLSGSGPTVFVLANELGAAQDVAIAQLARSGLKAKALTVGVDNVGLQLSRS